MNSKNGLFLILLLTVGAFSLLLLSRYYMRSKVETSQKERSSKNAFKEILDKTEDKNIAVNSSLEGKIIVLNVWATWCGPCIKEIPELNELVSHFKGNTNIVFIALSSEKEENEIETMKKRNIEFDYQLFFGQTELINILFSFRFAHESPGIPLNVVIDEEGNLEFYSIGYNPIKIKQIKDYLETKSTF